VDTEQLVAAVVAVAVLLTGGTYGGVRVVRARHTGDDTGTTDVLLARIGELEAALADERARASALEAEVDKLRAERRELSARVSHLEGQVTALTTMVQGLLDKGL
jgi:chromosome segregation ATPase